MDLLSITVWGSIVPRQGPKSLSSPPAVCRDHGRVSAQDQLSASLLSDGEQQLRGVADGEGAAVRVDHRANVIE